MASMMRSTLSPLRRRPDRERQRGSVAVLGAVWLSVGVILLASIDIGNLFWQKRELQKIADLAALAGAGVVKALDTDKCSGTTRETVVANAKANGWQSNPGTSDDAEVYCGRWDKNAPVNEAATPPDYFAYGGTPKNAVRVLARRNVPILFVFGSGLASRQMEATATAALTEPAAVLQIRNALVTVDTGKSVVLNTIIGGLLGGSLNLDAIGWQGLVDTHVTLLDYLDQLKANLGLGAGTYDDVLNADATVGQLLQAAIDLLQRNTNTFGAAVTALQAIQAAAQAHPVTLRLSELLGVTTGASTAALGLDLQAFQLVQGLVQLANTKNAVSAGLGVDVPSLVGAKVDLRIIESPRLSAIGNPALAKRDPLGENRILVCTAQVRTLASVDLSGVTTGIMNAVNSVLEMSSGLTTLLANVLNLDLISAVNNLLGGIVCASPNCPESKITYASALPATVDISLEAGGAQAYVTDYDCTNAPAKSLTAQAGTPIAAVRIGRISNAFSSTSRPAVAPVPLVEIGYRRAQYSSCVLSILLGSIGCSGQVWYQPSGAWGAKSTARTYVVAGIGLQVDSPETTGQARTLNFSAPPANRLPDVDVAFSDDDASFQTVSAGDLVGQVGTVVANVGSGLKIYKSDSAGTLGSVLSIVLGTLGTLVQTVGNLVSGLLSPLLDPVVNALLNALGIDLDEAKVGARLTCGKGAELVY
ncbi:TadG family pilus assembly protein [Xylophilus sp.]|uniref:TadG family pilus assembly protein n=1 Tax=Xylophilus sp. TaxID=2653893 RepID=UPI0013B8CE7A|nr:TadG family pilus assembly protein [Xylophilus sp.]KAF1041944.1 MAG: hypothetical protein GAK38_04466 [Xylophilus sp.]